MRYIIVVLVFVICHAGHSQNVNFEWAKPFYIDQSLSSSNISSSASDQDGNIYNCLTYKGIIDLDPGLNSVIDSTTVTTGYLVKLDSNGAFIWAKSLQSNDYSKFTDIKTTHDGNLILVGKYYGQADFDFGAGVHHMFAPTTNPHVFIQKITTDGDLIWVKEIQGNSYMKSIEVVVDQSDNIYLCGGFTGTADFDVGTGTNTVVNPGTGNYSWDTYLLKLDASGHFVWAKTFGIPGSGNVHPRAVALDFDDGVYLTGNYQDSVDMDPGTNAHLIVSDHWKDEFILKLDTAGNFQWVNTINGQYNDQIISDIECDHSNDCYLIGYFNNLSTYHASDTTMVLNTAGGGNDNDGCILKLNPNGHLDWFNTFGGYGVEFGRKLAIDYFGRIYFSSSINGALTFNTLSGVTSINGNDDVIVGSMNFDGTYNWVVSYGGNQGNLIMTDMILDRFNNIITLGRFLEVVNFNPFGVSNLTSFLYTGGQVNYHVYSLYVHKLKRSGTDIDRNERKDTVNTCSPYTWIDGETYTVNDKTAEYLMYGAAANGGDSLVTLHLIPNAIDVTVSHNEAELIANASGLSYQWLDCNNNLSKVQGETSQSFTPSSEGKYAVEITDGDCVDTSQCITMQFASVVENELDHQIVVFPNPVVDHFVFKTKVPISNITVIDALGQAVLVKSKVTNGTVVNTSNLSSGLYLLIVETEHDLLKKKLIVK